VFYPFQRHWLSKVSRDSFEEVKKGSEIQFSGHAHVQRKFFPGGGVKSLNPHLDRQNLLTI
jgi:hypothetical protein